MGGWHEYIKSSEFKKNIWTRRNRSQSPYAGIDHVGEHKVHHPIVAPEGDGTVDAVLDQLPQPGFLLIGENDAVHSVHASTLCPIHYLPVQRFAVSSTLCAHFVL